MTAKIKTLIFATVAVLILGVGVLVWATAPDSVPETDTVPADATVPASDIGPATSVPFTIPPTPTTQYPTPPEVPEDTLTPPDQPDGVTGAGGCVGTCSNINAAQDLALKIGELFDGCDKQCSPQSLGNASGKLHQIQTMLAGDAVRATPIHEKAFAYCSGSRATVGCLVDQLAIQIDSAAQNERCVRDPDGFGGEDWCRNAKNYAYALEGALGCGESDCALNNCCEGNVGTVLAQQPKHSCDLCALGVITSEGALAWCEAHCDDDGPTVGYSGSNGTGADCGYCKSAYNEVAVRLASFDTEHSFDLAQPAITALDAQQPKQALTDIEGLIKQLSHGDEATCENNQICSELEQIAFALNTVIARCT